MIMKKIITLIFINLISFNFVFAQGPITGRDFIENYKIAENQKNEQVLSFLGTYLNGILRGIQATSIHFKLKGRKEIYCYPDNIKILTEKRMITFIPKIDQDFKDGKTVYAENPLDAPLSITISMILNHYYPCN